MSFTFPLLSSSFPSSTDHQLVHRAIMRLNSNEQMEFEVSFGSDKPRSVKATMSLQVQDNLYNSTIIQVTGEAYQDIVSLDNITRSSQEMTQEDDERGKIRKESSKVVTEINYVVQMESIWIILDIFYNSDCAQRKDVSVAIL